MISPSNTFSIISLWSCRKFLRYWKAKGSFVIQSAVHVLLQQRANAGGKMCDCCGKTLRERQLDSLMRCKRCKMVFYCSPACQREHWKHKENGHKSACRARGEIKGEMTCSFISELMTQDYLSRLLHVSMQLPITGKSRTTAMDILIPSMTIHSSDFVHLCGLPADLV
jgi:MYND finger